MGPGRRLTCLHTHTCYCDGIGTVEDFCAAAAGKGLSAIGFSAHAPLVTDSGAADSADPGVTGSANSDSANVGWHLPMKRFAAYRADVEAAKAKWAGKIAVYLGLEADYIEGVASPGRCITFPRLAARCLKLTAIRTRFGAWFTAISRGMRRRLCGSTIVVWKRWRGKAGLTFLDISTW